MHIGRLKAEILLRMDHISKMLVYQYIDLSLWCIDFFFIWQVSSLKLVSHICFNLSNVRKETPMVILKG